MYLKSDNKQQGFVLILTLVLLAVLTLIGISSMNSATMELRATANAKQHQIAFNVVQSVLEYAVSANAVDADGVPLIDFQTNDPNLKQTVSHSVANGADITGVMEFAGCGPALGNSLGKGLKSNYYDITGQGSNAAGTAISVQVQGVRSPAASC